MLPPNLALREMHRDITILRKITTVEAPTFAASEVDCKAFKTETGTKKALPMH